jgi:cytochrome P450
MQFYHPFSPEIIENPHPVYRRLREEAPVYFLEEWDTFFLSRFQDIWDASMDGKSYSTDGGTTTAQLVSKVQPVTPMLANFDPPRHTLLRSRLAPYFTPGAVRRLEPRIAEIVAQAFEAVREKPEVDVYTDFAARVSVKVACLANGFPMEDSEMLNALVWRFFAREEGVNGMTEDGVRAMNEMFAYFGELVTRRRAAGADGQSVVDLICRYDEDGVRYDAPSASSHLSLFLIGGAETFPKTFASAVHRLWEHPEQRAQVAADLSLVPEAYREVLRFDMPTQYLMRRVKQPVTIHGTTLQPGQKVAFLYPSANRDAREFQDPDRFDVLRRPPRILSFGHGIHACIGQHFAKAEARLCIETLLRHAPEYEVRSAQLRRLRTEFVQGWESMPVVWG